MEPQSGFNPRMVFYLRGYGIIMLNKFGRVQISILTQQPHPPPPSLLQIRFAAEWLFTFFSNLTSLSTSSLIISSSMVYLPNPRSFELFPWTEFVFVLTHSLPDHLIIAIWFPEPILYFFASNISFRFFFSKLISK